MYTGGKQMYNSERQNMDDAINVTGILAKGHKPDQDNHVVRNYSKCEKIE